MVEQKTLGLILLVISTILYMYYTMWMLAMPIIDEDHEWQNYFPDRIYGVMIPTMCAYFLISCWLTSSGMILIQDCDA